MALGGAERNDGTADILPNGYSIGPWSQGLIGRGMWVAEVDVETPEGKQHVVFSSAGGLQREPIIAPQAIDQSVGHKA